MTQAIPHQDKIMYSGALILNEDGTYVYRIFDVLDNLVYVGVTKDIFARMNQHRRSSPWFHAAYRVEFDIYPDRLTAIKVETRSIVALRPSHNLTNFGDDT